MDSGMDFGDSNIFGKVLVFFVLCLVGLGVYLFYIQPIVDDVNAGMKMNSVNHAVERHGATAIDIIDVCRKNPNMVFRNDENGRIGVCADFEGKTGVTIWEDEDWYYDNEPITAFKNKSTTLDKIIDYFSNRGYSPVK